METVRLSWPVTDEELLRDYPHLAQKLEQWRNAARELKHADKILAWRLRSGETFKSLYGGYENFNGIPAHSWALKNDAPTVESVVFWIPDLAPESTTKPRQRVRELEKERFEETRKSVFEDPKSIDVRETFYAWRKIEARIYQKLVLRMVEYRRELMTNLGLTEAAGVSTLGSVAVHLVLLSAHKTLHGVPALMPHDYVMTDTERDDGFPMIVGSMGRGTASRIGFDHLHDVQLEETGFFLIEVVAI